jgi:hypothetical protein
MTKEEFIYKARDIITTDRNNEYCEAEDSFAIIADLWTAYLCTNILPEDVAAMMILMKVARMTHGHKYDNWTDVIGYAALGGEIASKRHNIGVKMYGGEE